MNRIEKNIYYLNIATSVSERSTCIRRNYGAVIVKDDIIVATGYNGSARGEVNCCDTGECYREQHGIPHGERYELCKAVHAEMNAIIQAGYEKTKGATLYLAGCDIAKDENGDATFIPLNKPRPCKMCWRAIKNAGILKVVAGLPIPTKDAYDVLFTNEEEENEEIS